ncbi:MAG: peroxide stress protein YaaA [Gammaproteobacteria bacterium]
MLTILSPAKTLDFDTPSSTKKSTQPEYLEHSSELIETLSALSSPEVSKLMSISDKLGELNFDRFQSWSTPFTSANAKQAILAFKGDVYTGLQAETFNSKELSFAQKHLRILSGLYGLLRPLDLMQPYRLEMGTKLSNERGRNLYQFWGEELTDGLNKQLKKTKSTALINLSSNEYYKAVKAKNINADIVTPVFKDFKNGEYKLISFFAKKARGSMAAFIIKNQIVEAKDLKDYCEDGYKYNKKLSTAQQPTFTRKQT